MGKILVDFDKTICPNGDSSLPPTQDCLDTLRGLRDRGNAIILFSVRSNPLETHKTGGHANMVEYIQKHNVPIDGIHRYKVHMDIIIDDRCFGIPKDANGNVDWAVVKRELLNEESDDLKGLF
jgi:hypothetical protein